MATISQNLKKEIKDFIERMGFNLLYNPEVTESEDNRYLLEIFVDDPRALIGERGVHLGSMQSIFRQISFKKYGSEIFIDIDVNGYKKKRSEFLREFAYSARERVLKEAKELELEPMNAYDRRIIHTTLAEYSDIKTQSTGETPYRRVVVQLI